MKSKRADDDDRPSKRNTPKRWANRRGAKVPRTKSGCYTCRIRRKKCDEQIDTDGRCEACVRLQIECLGFGDKRPDWLKGSSTVGEIREKIKNYLLAQGMMRGHTHATQPSSSSSVLNLSPERVDRERSPLPTFWNSANTSPDALTVSLEGSYTPDVLFSSTYPANRSLGQAGLNLEERYPHRYTLDPGRNLHVDMPDDYSFVTPPMFSPFTPSFPASQTPIDHPLLPETEEFEPSPAGLELLGHPSLHPPVSPPFLQVSKPPSHPTMSQKTLSDVSGTVIDKNQPNLSQTTLLGFHFGGDRIPSSAAVSAAQPQFGIESHLIGATGAVGRLAAARQNITEIMASIMISDGDFTLSAGFDKDALFCDSRILEKIYVHCHCSLSLDAQQLEDALSKLGQAFSPYPGELVTTSMSWKTPLYDQNRVSPESILLPTRAKPIDQLTSNELSKLIISQAASSSSTPPSSQPTESSFQSDQASHSSSDASSSSDERQPNDQSEADGDGRDLQPSGLQRWLWKIWPLGQASNEPKSTATGGDPPPEPESTVQRHLFGVHFDISAEVPCKDSPATVLHDVRMEGRLFSTTNHDTEPDPICHVRFDLLGFQRGACGIASPLNTYELSSASVQIDNGHRYTEVRNVTPRGNSNTLFPKIVYSRSDHGRFNEWKYQTDVPDAAQRGLHLDESHLPQAEFCFILEGDEQPPRTISLNLQTFWVKPQSSTKPKSPTDFLSFQNVCHIVKLRNVPVNPCQAYNYFHTRKLEGNQGPVIAARFRGFVRDDLEHELQLDFPPDDNWTIEEDTQLEDPRPSQAGKQHSISGSVSTDHNSMLHSNKFAGDISGKINSHNSNMTVNGSVLVCLSKQPDGQHRKFKKSNAGSRDRELIDKKRRPRTRNGGTYTRQLRKRKEQKLA